MDNIINRLSNNIMLNLQIFLKETGFIVASTSDGQFYIIDPSNYGDWHMYSELTAPHIHGAMIKAFDQLSTEKKNKISALFHVLDLENA